MSGELPEPRTAGATLQAIWIKRCKRGPMDPADSATLAVGTGIESDANRGGRREVTIIEEEKIAEMSRELGLPVEPVQRRANLMVRGLPLTGIRDRVLRIGATRLHVLGETHGCERMDEAVPGLRGAMKRLHGGGAYGRVLEGGTIRLGDPVAWEDGE